MPDETIKVTFQIRPMAKERLVSLKRKLLQEGYRESESSLIERLLAPSFISALETHVKRVPKVLCVLALLVLIAMPARSLATEPVVWNADLVHCRAEFTVSHMVVSKVWGHIPVQELTIVNAGRTPVPQRIDAVLDVSHEDTDNHDRDADLRSPTYFDVAKYPTMTFHSTSIKTKSDSEFVVTGDLTIKNVTKPVTFPVQIVGIIPEGNGWRVGYTAALTIDRRDWGIVDSRLTPAGVLLVGYTVNIGLTVEAVTNDPWLHART